MRFIAKKDTCIIQINNIINKKKVSKVWEEEKPEMKEKRSNPLVSMVSLYSLSSHTVRCLVFSSCLFSVCIGHYLWSRMLDFSSDFVLFFFFSLNFSSVRSVLAAYILLFILPIPSSVWCFRSVFFFCFLSSGFWLVTMLFHFLYNFFWYELSFCVVGFAVVACMKSHKFANCWS